MKFKLDENLPIEAATILSQAGHDAHIVLDEELRGASDAQISLVCREEKRVLVTLDTDFCNILAYPPETHPGIIVIRTLDQSKPIVLGFIENIANAVKSERVDGRLWIVQKDGIRLR